MEKQKFKIQPLTVKNFDKKFTDKYDESEQLVALQNSLIGKLSGWNDETEIVSDESLEILVKVYRPDKPCNAIYRRAVGYTSNDFTARDIMISYRSMKRLKLKIGDEIIVQRTCWFMYLWNHAQSHIRYPFQIAFWVALLSLLFAAASLIIGIYQFCCC